VQTLHVHAFLLEPFNYACTMFFPNNHERTFCIFQNIQNLFGHCLFAFLNRLNIVFVDATRTKQMAGELHSLAKRLVKAWEDAYKPSKLRPAVEINKLTGGRRKIRYGTGGDEQPGPKKGEMQLTLQNGKDLREQCDSIIQEATPIIEEFRTRVSRSNSFVAGNDSTRPIEALQKEEYRVYCSVQENSRLNPKVLSAKTVPRTLEFPEDLLTKHSGPLLITAPAGFGKAKGMVETSFTVGEAVVTCPLIAKNLDIAEQDFIRSYDLTPAEAAAFRARIERDGSASVPFVIREM
jgi:hypothetical protein